MRYSWQSPKVACAMSSTNTPLSYVVTSRTGIAVDSDNKKCSVLLSHNDTVMDVRFYDDCIHLGGN